MSSYYDIALSISKQMQLPTIGHSLTVHLHNDDRVMLSVDVTYEPDDEYYTLVMYAQLSDNTWHVIDSESEHTQDELIDIIIELLRAGYEYTAEEL